jgi:hypothetical protein|tara:strand:- start:204 stop:395 length:192 start_codon:yes stop_codon:yes gene_type:complete
MVAAEVAEQTLATALEAEAVVLVGLARLPRQESTKATVEFLLFRARLKVLVSEAVAVKVELPV